MSDASDADGLRDPWPLFQWTRRLLFFCGLTYIPLFGLSGYVLYLKLIGRFATFDYLQELALALAYMQVANGAFFVAGIFFAARLTYRSMRNVHIVRGSSELILPLWSVLWYVVPVFNLLMPPKAVQQIWSGTFGDDPNAQSRAYLIWLWWICGIGSVACQLAFGYFLRRDGFSGLSPGDFLNVVRFALSLLGTFLFIRLFNYIARAQRLLIQRATIDTFN